MKTKIRRFSKSVLSVILTMTLILSTMLIGTISVNAVGANNYIVSAGDYLYFDFSSFANSNSTIEANILDKDYIDTTDTTNYVNTNYFKNISGVVKVKLKKEINFSNYHGLLFKTNKKWATEVKGVANPLPSDGQNTLVITYNNSSSSYSYTWSTTGSGSGSGSGDTESDYYYSYWNGSNNVYVPMDYDTTKSLYKVTTNSTLLRDSKKFKINTSRADGTADDETNGTCLNLRNPKPTLTTSANSGATVGYNDNYGNCCITSTTTDFIVTYDPNATSSSENGEIKVWSVEDYNGTEDPQTYTITKAETTGGTFTVSPETAAAVGATITVTPYPDTANGYVVDKVIYTPVDGAETEVTLTNSAYTFEMPAKNVTVNVTFKKQYTITAGTCTGGSVTVGGSTSSVQVASGGKIPVIATAAENYEFVSWNAVEGVSFDDATSATTNATITGNAEITATFTSTSTEPTETFYIEYYVQGEGHKYIPYASYDSVNKVYSWETNFNFGSFSSDGKFRLTNTTTWTNGSESSFCVPAYKRTNQKGTETYVTVTASGASVVINSADFGSDAGSYGVSKYNDIKLNGIDTSKTYIVTYKPGTTNSLDGTITIADKSVTPTLATPKIKGDSAVLPNSTITVALDNQKDFGKDEDGNKVYTANDDSLTFTYTVTASDGSTPVVTPTASGKIAKSDGTAINDKISFTASSDNGVTYTITCKVSANGFDDVTSSELKVTVGTIPYAQANRIYAYAKTLGADETPALNAWVASESKVDAINTHNDSTDGNSTPEKNKVVPKLGNTSDEYIRIFLPTTASSDKVVLYNSFSSAITVNGTEIPSGGYEEVSYTPNTEYTISNGKKLTIYKSTADGALYLNNLGDLSGISSDGTVAMVNHLCSAANKDDSEIAAGNAGALADANGVQDVAVKKIKGRGNSTWVSANKKSFNVTFDANINAFGFEKGKKFSLLANFKDPSLSRNKILYELADLMGVKYSPDAATVDLYMNGLYMGSYLMCQKVEVGSKELVNDLGKTLLEDLYTDEEAGKVLDSSATTIQEEGFSFLIELDSNATTGDFYTTVGDQTITIKEPEYLDETGNIPTDEVTKAAIKFVQDRYSELNTAMSNTSITLEQLNNIIDVDSLAKYYLVNEIAKNYDIGVSSTYLVYNYTDRKFYISPLWDMDVTTANCKVGDTNYQSYESNWTDNTNENTGNKFMATVFKNPQVQSAVRKLWTNSYYTTLTGYIDTLTTKATDVEGSLNCNYIKWNYPYGFQGKYRDNVQARTSLKKATYNPSDNSYTVDSSETGYATTAVGQTQFVSDWLKSRVAWMSKKYNTYTIAGLTGWSGVNDKAIMTNNGDGTHTYTFTSAAEPTYGIKIYTDNGIKNTDITKPEDSTHACIWYDPDVQLVVNTSRGTLTKTKGDQNNFGVKVTEASAEAPVYLIYNQKTNTLTLSDTESTLTKPAVTLNGSDVLNENIKDGTAVALTAKITPATSNNAVVTGDYTATLYIGEKKVTAKTVTFTATDDTKDVVFDTYLEGTNQTYKVVVTCNDGEQDLKGTSNKFTYKQTGIKDQKIYFDPSTYSTIKDKNATNRPFPWLEAIDKDSTVTVTIKDSNSTQLATFKMYIDSEDVYGLAKGVFRADIDETTLGYLKVPTNTIHFALDGHDNISTDYYNDTINGSESITSGWIYNYSWQEGQSLWEQYNVDYVEAYPGGCTTYAQFKDYLDEQATVANTDNIVYFDNSASKFYNVYLYCWGDATTKTSLTTNAVLMKKLPYADIWYYDFGSNSTMPTKDFLFKDRSNAGFGNNYQETVDLVGKNSSDHNQCVQDGNGTWIPLNFENTISTPNPIFITQNFYKVTEKNGGGTLKFRAFNTEWKEFSAVVESEVQTKAVDVYFDLHNASATDIQLYHSSTSNNYSFATKFTRLTPLPGSTIYHSTIKLPYTDKGIAFKFDRFIVDYSDGSTKTCAMSNNVQPTFTCINTGEVWYEINSNFDSVSNDAETGANLRKVSSPLLTATSDYYVADDKIKVSPFTGTETKLVNNGEGIYSYHYTDIAVADYKFKITDGSSNWDVANWKNYSPDKSSLTNITVADSGSVNKIKVSLSKKTSFTVYYNGANVYIIEDPSAPTPTISFTPDSISLTLDNGSASTTLTPTVTNASGKTVSYSVDKTDGVTLTPSTDTLSADFAATKAGTYVVTATIDGTTVTAPVTITVSEPVTTDYCGVLAYNHSTATFDVTGGGTIDKTEVVLTNGYYKNTAGDNTVTTGYTSYDGTTYTVIYALPSTASSGATTSYSSTTSHTADSNYKFNDWTKNGIVKSTDTALSDEISGTSTVAYVANWSVVQKVSYTFTYKYYEFDTSKGMAYAEGRDTIPNDGYVIQVTLPENSSVADIQKAYLANAPKLESDYFIYSFDDVTITVDGLTASATANNDTIRYYTVRFDNGDTITVNNYYYQHVAELTYDGPVPTGKYVAWMNENGEILHYGTTYKFRVTRNIDIQYAFVDSNSVSPATYVNEPTYEFYINDTGKEYVRFNILVENVLADLSVDNVEFGTLYFFTDSTGKPNDSTISVEVDFDPKTLITVSDGRLNVKSGVGQHNVNTVSSEYKYIYAPKMPNTSANVDRYVRVYSYIAVKGDNGKYKDVIVSNSYALASIRDALNKS